MSSEVGSGHVAIFPVMTGFKAAVSKGVKSAGDSAASGFGRSFKGRGTGIATFGKGRHNRLFQQLFGCHRMLLACTRMQLRHPVGGQRLDLRAPPDGEFAVVLAALGWKEQETGNA